MRKMQSVLKEIVPSAHNGCTLILENVAVTCILMETTGQQRFCIRLIQFIDICVVSAYKVNIKSIVCLSEYHKVRWKTKKSFL